jgi:hypothetical protein
MCGVTIVVFLFAGNCAKGHAWAQVLRSYNWSFSCSPGLGGLQAFRSESSGCKCSHAQAFRF